MSSLIGFGLTPAGLARAGCGLFARALWHVAEVGPGKLDRLFVVGHQRVAQPAFARVHPSAAELFERDLLPDHHLDHPRRAEVHRSVALDHDHDVAEGGYVSAAGR